MEVEKYLPSEKREFLAMALKQLVESGLGQKSTRILITRLERPSGSGYVTFTENDLEDILDVVWAGGEKFSGSEDSTTERSGGPLIEY